MSQTVRSVKIWPLRTLPKDIGVAVVVLVALGLGLLLRWSLELSSTVYTSADNNFSISYPANWRTSTVTDTNLLQVENPETISAYKTNVSVESRELDPASPPTIQELIDRRVVQRGNLTGYHFLSNADSNVGGARAAEIDYAFVAQPIDTPRRAALPVVARSREYVVVTQNRVYYITLSAPENDFDRASGQFDNMLQTVRVQ